MEGYLIWEAPGGTLSILVRRDLLSRLKYLAEDAFSGGLPDSGGVLLGRAEDLIESGQRIITIEDAEVGLSRLRDSASVGFVRFRRQQELHLNEADFLALRAGVGLVCLITRPDARHGAIGGFFYMAEKTIRYPVPEMQFPIDPASPDCRTLPSPEAEDEVDDDAGKEPKRAKRLVYAAVGLALLLSPVVVWLLNG